MAKFTGQLNTNKVFASLFNMIISMQVFDQGISGLGNNTIYESRRVDGTLFGDTKLYISTDALKSYVWDGNDLGYNLLTKHMPPEPEESYIQMGVYRQIPLTITNYLVKQAFYDEGSFGQFTGVMLGWMNTTKSVYEHTKFTSDIMITTIKNAKLLNNINITPPTDVTGYDAIKWKAQEMFRQLEDSIAELAEPERSYNDFKFLRNYHADQFDIVVPRGILSGVRKHDVPFLYNPDNKPFLKEIHWKYFGSLNNAAGTTPANNTTIRSYIEADFGTGENIVHLFPGDLLPASTAYAANTTYTSQFEKRPDMNTPFSIYLIDRRDFPIMSAFVVNSSFYNARRLDINNYLTFGTNKVDEAHIGEFALLKLDVSVDTP